MATAAATEDVGAPPAGPVPFALQLPRAAFHLGMSEREFYRTKQLEGFPEPVVYGGRRRWITRELEAWALQHRRSDLKLAPVPGSAPPRRRRKTGT